MGHSQRHLTWDLWIMGISGITGDHAVQVWDAGRGFGSVVHDSLIP